MAQKIRELTNNLLIRFKLEAFREFFLFAAILISLHLIWKGWGLFFNYNFFGFDLLGWLSGNVLNTVRHSSAWFIRHILGIETRIHGETLIFYESARVGVSFGCSGIKQFYQFAGLMLFYPGPWSRKGWFIPSGLFILHLVNLIRVISLSLVVIYIPQHFECLHDWILRPLFYVVMFAMWLIWEEKLRNKKSLPKMPGESL